MPASEFGHCEKFGDARLGNSIAIDVSPGTDVLPNCGTSFFASASDKR